MRDRYLRRIGAEEESRAFIAVMKANLPVFPPAGEPFEASVSGTKCTLVLESYPCECRGPARPHEHWFIQYPGLRRGQSALFTRNPDNTYDLAIAD